MEKSFVEVFFCNSDNQLNDAIKILETENIAHSVNQTNDESHKYSISVSQDKVDEVLKLLNEIKDSQDDSIQYNTNENKESDRRIIGIIAIALITILLISAYKVGGKIYSKIKDKKSYAHYLELKNNSQTEETSAKTTRETEMLTGTENLTETEQSQQFFYFEDNEPEEATYEKGGIILYEDGLFCDVPEDFEIQHYREIDLDEEPELPEEPISEISITMNTILERLEIRLPVNVYSPSLCLYLEAEHDGEVFFCYDKEILYFQEETNYNGIVTDYYTSVNFINKNLYSTDNTFIVRLIDGKTEEIFYQEIIELLPVYYDFVVYRDDYKSPFTCKDNQSIRTNEKMHLIYTGRPSEGDMIVISYDPFDFGLSYVPFAAIKTKSDTDGVCSLDFKIRQPGQYKIDFYNEETGKIRITSVFDYLEVRADKNFYVEVPAGTTWKVISPEGLRLRTAPWGQRIGLLEDGMEVLQTKDTMYPFYDFIDGEYGYWIPVRVLGPDAKKYETEWILKNDAETMGWVFSGFLKRNQYFTEL